MLPCLGLLIVNDGRIPDDFIATIVLRVGPRNCLATLHRRSPLPLQRRHSLAIRRSPQHLQCMLIELPDRGLTTPHLVGNVPSHGLAPGQLLGRLVTRGDLAPTQRLIMLPRHGLRLVEDGFMPDDFIAAIVLRVEPRNCLRTLHRRSPSPLQRPRTSRRISRGNLAPEVGDAVRDSRAGPRSSRGAPFTRVNLKALPLATGARGRSS